MEVSAESKSYGGIQKVLKHQSECLGCEMTFAVYLPPQAEKGPVPCLWYLSGLTCTHENAMTKAGLQAHASRHGLAVVFPDTSPRGDDIPDHADYDLGQGAGFYIDATKAPWKRNFQMYTYITSELRELVEATFPVNDKRGITGHSMGGHGAITIAVKNPELYTSASAFSPIANPSESEWGKKQFINYIGNGPQEWKEHDASVLLSEKGFENKILVDQGTGDQFFDLLKPNSLDGLVELRMQDGYDHSYFFVSTFAGDHVQWHAELLG